MDETQEDVYVRLRRALETIFSDNLVSVSYKSQSTLQPVFMLSGNVLHPYSSTQYSIRLSLQMSIANVLKGNSIRPSSHMQHFTIGEYVPSTISQRQDLKGATLVVEVEYNVSDILDFLEQAEKLTWDRWDKAFINEFEEAIDYNGESDDRDKK